MSLFYLERKPRVAEPGRKPPVLLLLHGVRSNEQDLLGLAPVLDPRFHVVSLRAPLVLGPGAYGWYRVEWTSTGHIIDEEAERKSRGLLLEFIEELPSKLVVDGGRVFLMGFSQGCIMSLGAALTEPSRFAGIVGMSGHILPSVLSERAPDDALRDLPVLVVHGTRDTVLPVEYGREIRRALSVLPLRFEYREYPMAHEVSRESLSDIAGWLTAALDDPLPASETDGA